MVITVMQEDRFACADRLIDTIRPAHFSCSLGEDLRQGRGMPQIFAVLEGSGEVSGANGVGEPIGAGEAIFLHEGEDHEMKSEAGLTVLVLEGASLERFRGRPTAPSASE